MKPEIRRSLKLDDEYNLHPSGIIVQRALDRAGTSKAKLARACKLDPSSITRLLKLERDSFELILNALLGMVKLRAFTSIDDIKSYLNEVPANSLTTVDKSDIVFRLQEALDGPPDEKTGSRDEKKGAELTLRILLVIFREKMAQDAGKQNTGKTADELYQVIVGSLGQLDLAQIAQAIEQESKRLED